MDWAVHGGLLSLVIALREHGEAIESDLLRWYHVDILDLGTPTLTWRRLGVLLSRLPRESWYVRATAGEAVQWGVEEHLLAAIVDAVQVTNWILATVNAKKGKGPPPPTPVHRPGSATRAVGLGTSKTPQEMRKILDAWRSGSDVS